MSNFGKVINNSIVRLIYSLIYKSTFYLFIRRSTAVQNNTMTLLKNREVNLYSLLVVDYSNKGAMVSF